MNLPGLENNHEADSHGAPMADINTTPLVDVMLVLLVIFLVTAPMLTQSINLELPSEKGSESKGDDPLTLSVDAAGSFYLNKQIIPAPSLEETLQKIAQTDPNRAIHLRADQAASYGHVMKVLALCQQLGLTNIGFITQPNN